MVLISIKAQSRTIKVGLEPFPPLINSNKTGYTIDLLEQVGKVSGLKFEYIIMPYSRAKSGLKTKTLDLIAHTPFENESKNFYTYASELYFSIEAHVDIISLDSDFEDLDSFVYKNQIGTPRGNEEFFSSLYNITLKNFYPGELESLILMLKKGRIKYLIFDRAAMNKYCTKYIKKKVYYKSLGLIGAGFAVSNSKEGSILKKKIESSIKKINTDKIYQNYLKLQEKKKTGTY